MVNINKEFIKEVFDKKFNPLEDKTNNLSKELVLKEIENLPPVEDEYADKDIIENRNDIKAYLNGKLKEFASAENDEYKVSILSNTRFLYIRKDDINHPVPRHFWLQLWDSYYETEFRIDKERYKELTQKEKAIIESKLQLKLWIDKEYYTEYTRFYFPKEYSIWFDEINPLCDKRKDYWSCMNEQFKQKLHHTQKNKSHLTGNDIFDITTTGMPYYDTMIQKGHIAGNRDPVKYFKTNKGLVFEIVWMSPEDYLRESYKLQNYNIDYLKYKFPLKYYIERSIDPEKINEYTERTLEGSKMPIPVLDYNDMSQEGRHRAVVAKELGVEEMPVLVVRTYEGD